MRNSFLSSLRHLSEGTRLYGRDQPGQMLAIIALNIYLPVTLPLLRDGVWIGFAEWLNTVAVPSAGLILAGYAVIVAIVIALSLTPPSIAAEAPLAPYPVERPVKSRIIHNCRLFLGSMIGLGAIGVIFTSGMDRLEHLVCVAIGALLLQLGHLDEVNAAQTDSVLMLLGDQPQEAYDQWYSKRWGIQRIGQKVRAHRWVLRRKLGLIFLQMLVHISVLLSYIAVVHGTAGLAQHWTTVVGLSTATSVVNSMVFDAVFAALLALRHSKGSRNSSGASHPETYFALLAIGAKLVTTAAMLALPLTWMTEANRGVSLGYMAFLSIEVLWVALTIIWLVRRWRPAHSITQRVWSSTDGQIMAILLKKRAARDRAAIRGAITYRGHHEAATSKDRN